MSATLRDFIARQKAEREAAGLPPMVASAEALRAVAVIVGRRGGGHREAA